VTPPNAPSSIVEILIAENAFKPAETTIAAGTTVRWTNTDPVCLCGDFHIVQSGTANNPTNEFDFTFMEMDDTGERTFHSPGTFDYFCKIHGETGKIIVE